MSALCRITAIMAILTLVIFGLNISNQGINSLTMQTRQPVIGLQTQGNSVSIYTLGETHKYDQQYIHSAIVRARSQIWVYSQITGDYMMRIARVIKVFLLGEVFTN